MCRMYNMMMNKALILEGLEVCTTNEPMMGSQPYSLQDHEGMLKYDESRLGSNGLSSIIRYMKKHLRFWDPWEFTDTKNKCVFLVFLVKWMKV